jgi:membrane protease YdiL (CAAX protease family)
MRNLLKSLPPGAEFIIVIVGAFGLSILGSVLALLHVPHAAQAVESSLWAVIIHQAVLVAVLGSFLYIRDWNATRLGLVPHWSDLVWAIALMVAASAIYYGAWHLIAWLAPRLLQTSVQASLGTSAVSAAAIAAFVLVNPVFEELFVAGYVIAALKDTRGETFAINASVVIRLLYNLHLGATGVIATIPMGLVFGYWFARKGRLWPLIGAHALVDLAGLLYYLYR